MFNRFRKVKPAAAAQDRRTDGDLAPSNARIVATDTFAIALSRARARLVDAGSHDGVTREIGETLLKWGRAREAAQYLLGGASEATADPLLAFDIGWSSFACGDVATAARYASLALTGDDSVPDHWLLSAEIKRAQGEIAEAASMLARMLSKFPDNYDALTRLAQIHLMACNFREAITFATSAIGVDDSRASPFATCARAYNLLGELTDADASYRTAIARDIQALDRGINSFIEYGNFLREAGRSTEAIELFMKWLPDRPSYAGSGDLALARLTAGQLREAWDDYEFRWLNKALSAYRTPFLRPPWQGQDLNGRSILLRDEQGVGDCIQFVRYAAHLRGLGAKVYLQARDSWRSVAMQVQSVDRFLTPEDEVPQFDFYCHFLSLPRVFGTSLTTIPADVPYIEAKAQWVERWAGRVSGRAGLKVGLVWAGNPSHTNDANRSLNLLQLLPVLGVKGVTFFALQKGARSEQALEYAGDSWVNLGPEINDFTDTAGIIESMDLVICVDTSVAHLAGAMAKPVWLLLPKPSDFRWMEDREDSPWYPTMRLFRQKARGDWKDVIARLKLALERQVEEGVPAPWTRKPSVPLQVAYPTQWIAGVTKLPGHRPGLSAVAETRMGMVQYLPDEPVVGDAIAWYGEYLQAQVDFLSTQVAAGSTVMEVEAGIGLHALALSRMVGSQGHVMLYESDVVKKQILEQNLEAHGVRNATLMRRRIGGVPEAEPVAGEPDGVPQHETLDDLQVERLDWLKVNGGRRALEVLAGGEETIWRLRPRVLVAMTGVENDQALVAELQQRLLDLGYVYSDCAITAIVTDNFKGRPNEWNGDRLAAMFVAVPEEAPDTSALPATKKLGAQSH